MSRPFSDTSFARKITAPSGEAKPLTVAQLVNADRIGGAEQAALEVSRAVVALGGRALIGAGGALAGRMRVTGAESFAFQPETGRLRRGRSVSALVDALGEAEVDVIHARSPEMAAAAQDAARALGAGFVTTLHEAPETGWRRSAGAKALVAADRVIAVSEDLAARAGVAGAVAIPRGADMEVFAEEVVGAARTIKLTDSWGLAEDVRPIILAPGRLTASNGHDVLIEAVGLLKRLSPDFLCLIVGAGEQAYADGLEARIVAAGLGGHVRLVGRAEDMPAALKISAVVVSAATSPPASGRAMIEAQAMGRPVIAPAHGAMTEVVAHGETGWLTAPGDAAALADAMAEALSMDESQRAHIGMAGRARVRARFTLGAMLEAILAVYEDVSGKTFRPPLM